MKKKSRFLNFITILFSLFILTSCNTGTILPPPTSSPSPVQKIDIPAGFDKEYFEEICFLQEYSLSNHPTYRWVEDPKIFLINPPTEEKRKICENKMGELAKFTNYVLSPEIVNDINLANITVEWCELEDIYQQNVGCFYIFQSNNIIFKVTVKLFKGLDSILTKHNFLEEVGGGLGVTNDSYKYDDSIFYQGPCQSIGFTIQDLAVGNVLYQLEPGTSREEFNIIYENSTKNYSSLNGF